LKSVKELSESIKVSNVSVYKLVKRDDIAPHTSKVGGVTMVDEEGEELIRAHYGRDRVGAIDSNVGKVDASVVALLQEQLRIKDAQIKALIGIIEKTKAAKKFDLSRILNPRSPRRRTAANGKQAEKRPDTGEAVR